MKRGWVRLVAGLLSGIAAFLLSLAGILDPLEWKSWDWRLRNFSGAPRPVENVALLLVDQKSLDYMESEQGIPWPWPRSLYVPVIEYCRAAGAKGIVFDILFTESSMYGVEDDAELAASIAAGGDVILAEFVSAREGGADSEPVVELREAARATGNVGFPPDDDGIFRRIPRRPERPTLPFAACREFEAERRVPLDRHGNLIVRFAGPAGTVPSYSMASAIQSFVREREGGEIALPKELLAGRYVFLGMSAPGLLDLRPTPFGAVNPGAELHATVLENLIAGDFVRELPRWIEFLRCVVPSLLLAYLIGRIRGAWTGAILLPLFAGVLVVSAGVGCRFGLWIPFVSPLLAVLLAFLSMQTIEYATEGRQRRFLKHAFRHYLSPQVIDEIVRDPSKLELGGVRKELTIFFSDVAAFTTLSEGLEPEALTGLLNRYLTEMTDVIHAEGGTVDKYEGDAIIAFWNAPADQPDHAERALRAAMFCLERLREINPELQKTAGSPLEMRIGIHTGPVVVGNMGSRDRFDYTVIGDAANLASRLEGLGKVFRSPVLISEETWKRGKGAVHAREIGRVRVVGRREPVRIFQPGVRRGDMPFFRWWRQDDPAFGDALRAYYAGELERAREQFASIEDDPVASVYVRRCDEIGSGPLPPDWDGVWEMESK